jgi:hypothetical protein
MDIWHDGEVERELVIGLEHREVDSRQPERVRLPAGASSLGDKQLSRFGGGNPSLMRALQELAASTMSNYNRVMENSAASAAESITKKIRWTGGQEDVHSIAQMNNNKAGLAEISQFGPALILWLDMRQGDASEFRYSHRAIRPLEAAK